ncbi:PHD zinc finger domain-containing protein [Encephalitozoon cuniculi EcunIII-L]|nr:PHD zinc finger domain-containing protein [Encephalitozoon cuniculi EcunIII-L]
MSTSGWLGGIPREEHSYKAIYRNLELSRMHRVVSDHVPMSEEKHEGKKTIDEEQPRGLFESVIYRLDGYDQRYLRESAIDVSEDAFELIVDRLEKEWFFFVHGLVDRHVKPIEPASFCDICTRHTSTHNEALVVCQGCEICVHESCYGIQDLSSFWLCRKCIYGEYQIRCSFCISSDGIFKQTSDNRWGHVLCAMFNRFLSFGHLLSKDPIDVSSYLEESGCLFCNEFGGTAIHCSYFMCTRKYHVGCALDKCYFDLNNGISYCIDHDPLKRNPYELGYGRMNGLRYFGYEKLRNPPAIRRKVRMARPRATLFMKLCKLQPVATPSVLSRVEACDLKEKDSVNIFKVSRYWELKRKEIGGPLVILPGIVYGRKTGEDWMSKRRM